MTNLEEIFPGLLSSDYWVTSPEDVSYNCIAWAAGLIATWWEPDPYGQYYWPAGASRGYNLNAYVDAYAQLGFEPCRAPDMEYGCLKVAIFVKPNGKPSHAARQLPSGRWTSKLGRGVDIEHDLIALEGDLYGRVAIILKRDAPDPRATRRQTCP